MNYQAPSEQAFRRHLVKDHGLGLSVRHLPTGPAFSTFDLPPDVVATRVRALRNRKGGRGSRKNSRPKLSATSDSDIPHTSLRSSTPVMEYLPVEEMASQTTFSTVDSEDLREMMADVDADITFDSECFEEALGLRESPQPHVGDKAELYMPPDPSIERPETGIRVISYSPISSPEPRIMEHPLVPPPAQFVDEILSPSPESPVEELPLPSSPLSGPTPVTLRVRPLAIVTADALLGHPEASPAAVARVIANAVCMDCDSQRDQFAYIVEFAVAACQRMLSTVLVRQAVSIAETGFDSEGMIRNLLRDANYYNDSWKNE